MGYATQHHLIRQRRQLPSDPLETEHSYRSLGRVLWRIARIAEQHIQSDGTSQTADTVTVLVYNGVLLARVFHKTPCQ
jgi:hypothetical protein